MVLINDFLSYCWIFENSCRNYVAVALFFLFSLESSATIWLRENVCFMVKNRFRSFLQANRKKRLLSSFFFFSLVGRMGKIILPVCSFLAVGFFPWHLKQFTKCFLFFCSVECHCCFFRLQSSIPEFEFGNVVTVLDASNFDRFISNGNVFVMFFSPCKFVFKLMY